MGTKLASKEAKKAQRFGIILNSMSTKHVFLKVKI